MFKKILFSMLFVICCVFILSGCEKEPPEVDDPAAEEERRREKEKEAALAEAEQKEVQLKAEAKAADQAGTATKVGTQSVTVPATVQQQMPSLTGALSGVPAKTEVTISAVCERTEQIKQAILEKAEKEDCAEVTFEDLSAIVILELGNRVGELKADDFSGLNALELLDLNSNELESLPPNTECFTGALS